MVEKLCEYAVVKMRNNQNEIIVVNCNIDRDIHTYERCREENKENCDVYKYRDSYKREISND